MSENNSGVGVAPIQNMPTLNQKEHIKLGNQSRVFEAFGPEEKLTIAELTARVNERLEGHEKLSDQTIRRAVASLTRSGLIKPFGKNNNAQTYGKLSAAMTADEGEKLIPFGGELLNVGDFVKLMASPEVQPFTLKLPLLDDTIATMLRKVMLHVVITAPSPGYNEELKKHAKRIHNVIAGLEFATQALRSFIDSPVWYEQYRDRIAYALRRLQQEDPELYQLAQDYLNTKEG
jgi:hypothetical protein